jgi:hypothetical protein
LVRQTAPQNRLVLEISERRADGRCSNGTVLFVGNEENDGTPADAEIFDPAVGTFYPDS